MLDLLRKLTKGNFRRKSVLRRAVFTRAARVNKLAYLWTNPIKVKFNTTCKLFCVVVHHPPMSSPNKISSFTLTDNSDARVLILGSMPGVASLAAQQYYAHPRNAFWPLMARLCGFDNDLAYPLRLQALQAAGIRLWDMLASCERLGSSDAAIAPGSVQINAIAALLQRSQLQAVALNGALAMRLFPKFVAPELPQNIQIFALPSTSPAHAAKTFEQKWQDWQVLTPLLRAKPSADTSAAQGLVAVLPPQRHLGSSTMLKP